MRRLALAWLLVLAGTAHGDGFRAVVDRVDLEPASITGYRLRVYLSALAMGGQLLDLTDPKSIRLFIGSSEKKPPFALGTYDATGAETAIVVVAQTTLDYADVLPMITDSLEHDVLATLPDRTQVAIVPYGEAVGVAKLAPVKALRGRVAIANDGSAGDPALLDAVDRALLVLRKAKSLISSSAEGRPLRKMIVVIGDGRDRSGDKERVTRTGNRASKEGVRIHALAFSSTDTRRPMLALGELSKRSLGTFRWVRKPTADSWSAALRQMRDEIGKQYVLTYFVSSDDDVLGKRLHVVATGRTEATSNEVKVPEQASCAGEPCDPGYCADDKCLSPAPPSGRGVLGWLVLVLGIAVAGAVVLGVIGFVITKRQEQPGGAPKAPKPPKPPKPGKPGPIVVAPGLLPNGRPIPALLITSGPRTGERHLVKNGFLIGKQPGCDLLIEDGYTSSQHAQIAMDLHGNCRLYDRGSTNGTYINGARISEDVLAHGVTIRIGSTEMRFLAQ